MLERKAAPNLTGDTPLPLRWPTCGSSSPPAPSPTDAPPPALATSPLPSVTAPPVPSVTGPRPPVLMVSPVPWSTAPPTLCATVSPAPPFAESEPPLAKFRCAGLHAMTRETVLIVRTNSCRTFYYKLAWAPSSSLHRRSAVCQVRVKHTSCRIFRMGHKADATAALQTPRTAR